MTSIELSACPSDRDLKLLCVLDRCFLQRSEWIERCDERGAADVEVEFSRDEWHRQAGPEAL